MQTYLLPVLKFQSYIAIYFSTQTVVWKISDASFHFHLIWIEALISRLWWNAYLWIRNISIDQNLKLTISQYFEKCNTIYKNNFGMLQEKFQQKR